MRKPNGARLTSDAALLPLYGVGLVVRHGSDHADEVDGTIASVSRGLDAQATASDPFHSCRFLPYLMLSAAVPCCVGQALGSQRWGAAIDVGIRCRDTSGTHSISYPKSKIGNV